MLLMLVISSVLLLCYVVLIIRYSCGWSKIKEISKKGFFPKVSIVISLRNEESQINNLFSSLRSQSYPYEKLQIILVNDHSTDNTLSLLHKFDLDNLQVINMPEGKQGKKAAIRMAVSLATGDIILASDADCIFGAQWVQSMVSYFSDYNVKLVSGPVFFNNQRGFFQNLQALEFASLIGSGAGSIGINNALFCNGANMAYRKEVFLQMNILNDKISVSGDDVFLLHSVKAKYINSIVFAKDKDAIVLTQSLENLTNFINQRKRWAAKSIKYKDFSSIYTSYLVFFTNLFFILLFFIIFIDTLFFPFFIAFYFVKFIVDIFLLQPILHFFNRKDLIKWIFPFELFYSFYIVLISILSFTSKFEWKDRMYKR